MKNAKRNALAIGLAFALLLSAAPASADVEPDPATDTQVAYAPPREEGYLSERIGGNMSVYTAIVQRNTTIYANNDASTPMGALKKGDVVVIVQHSEGGYAADTKWIKILFNDQVGQITRRSLTPPGKEHPSFYLVLEDYTGSYARSAKSLYVYAKASSTAKKLGVVRKGSNAILVREGKKYDTVLAGSVIGYVKHGSLKSVDRAQLDEGIAKAMGTYIPVVDWDYGGRVSAADRESQQIHTAYVNTLRFYLAAPNYEFQIIEEHHFANSQYADAAQKSLMENRAILLTYSDLGETREWNPKYALHCYRNGDTIIVYIRGDEDASQVLAELEQTHGAPFKVWKGALD